MAFMYFLFTYPFGRWKVRERFEKFPAALCILSRRRESMTLFSIPQSKIRDFCQLLLKEKPLLQSSLMRGIITTKDCHTSVRTGSQ